MWERHLVGIFLQPQHQSEMELFLWQISVSFVFSINLPATPRHHHVGALVFILTANKIIMFLHKFLVVKNKCFVTGNISKCVTVFVVGWFFTVFTSVLHNCKELYWQGEEKTVICQYNLFLVLSHLIVVSCFLVNVQIQFKRFYYISTSFFE